MSADFWFQRTGEAPDPDVIGSSLRFRGGQRLHRNLFMGQVRTYSWWSKYEPGNGNVYQFFHGSGNPYIGIRSGGDPTPDSWQTLNQGSAFTQIYRDGVVFRDPSGWSHFVMRCTSTDVIMYLNGEEWGRAGGPNSAMTNLLFEIGCRGNAEFFNGYQADWHCVDNQSLGPEFFGSYNSAGIWVPLPNEDIQAALNALVLGPFPTNAVDLVEGWDANSTNPDACWSNDYNNGNGVKGNVGVTNWTGSIPVPAGTQQILMKIGSGGGSWSPSSGHVIVNGTDVGGRFPVGGTLNPAEADITDACGTEITSIRISSTQFVANTQFFGLKFDGRIVQTDQNRAVYPEGATPEYMSTGWSFTGNGGNPKNAFNGDLQSGTGSSNGTCNWTGNIPVPAGAQVFVHAGSGGGSGSNEAFQINGNHYGNRVPSPFVGITRIEVTDLVTTGAITQLFLRGTPSVVNAALTGIEIVDNGVSNIVVEPLTPYGPGGFHLNFSNPNNIGQDISGNANDFNHSGFEVSNPNSRLYDVTFDSPSNNFSTLNPLVPGPSGITSALANGTANHSGNYNRGTPNNTIKLPSSGKFQAEFAVLNTGEIAIALTQSDNVPGDTVVSYYKGGAISLEGSGAPIGNGAVFTSGDVIGVTVDVDNTTLRFYKNGVAQFQDIDYSPAPDSDNCYLTFKQGSSSGACSAATNYGQQEFVHPVAGFEPLCSGNLPRSNLPNIITGTFTGNNSANGPFIYTGCLPGRIQYGSVDVSYEDRLGQTDVDFLCNGFKVRSTTSNSGSVSYAVITTHAGTSVYSGRKVPFGDAAHAPAPAGDNSR